MYRKCDGVAMGSPLGPVMAGIFVGYCESKIPVGECPSSYCRFVDDSFSLCRDIDHCESFLESRALVRLCRTPYQVPVCPHQETGSLV